MADRFGGKRNRSKADQRDDSNPELFIINHHLEPDKIEKFVLRLKDDPEVAVRRFAAKTKMTAVAERQLLDYALKSKQEFLDEWEAANHQTSPLAPLETEGSPIGNLKQKGFSSKFSESQSQHRQVTTFNNTEEAQRYANEMKPAKKPPKFQTSPSNLYRSNRSNEHIDMIRFKGVVTEPGQPAPLDDPNNEDEFADRIARQIQEVSQIIYKTEGHSQLEKSSGQRSRQYSGAKFNPQASEAQVHKERSNESQCESEDQYHLASIGQRKLSSRAIPTGQETSFRSFNDKPRRSVDRHNKSHISEDGEKIFLKLYNDGIVKYSKRSKQIFEKQMREEAELNQIKIDAGRKYSRDIVDRLYYKGIVKEDVKKFHNERLRSMQESEKGGELTFHPKISNISKIIAETREERGNKPIEEYLISKGQSKARYLEQVSAAKLGHELSQLQEKPRISEVSKILAFNRSQMDEGRPRVSKHEELFEESTQRRQRSMILQEAYNSDGNHPYQPEINEESRRIVESKHGQQRFVERLSKYASDREAKLMIEKARLNPPFSHMLNPETNMPYFHPVTGRPPSTSREREAVGVGPYLHSLSVKMQQKLDEQREIQYSRKSREREAIPQSSFMIEQRKNFVFKSIFDSLDSDSDGVISADKINIEVIDSDILKIISPMLINMEELSMEIDEATFIYGMQEIYKKLCVADRDKLISGFRAKRAFVDEECTFRPHLNAVSLRMAANKKSLVETVSLLGAKKRAELQNKYELDSEGNALAMINEENSETRSMIQRYHEEMQDCTFQPQLNDYVPTKSHYV